MKEKKNAKHSRYQITSEEHNTLFEIQKRVDCDWVKRKLFAILLKKKFKYV